jgi:hypothetical protein
MSAAVKGLPKRTATEFYQAGEAWRNQTAVKTRLKFQCFENACLQI